MRNRFVRAMLAVLVAVVFQGSSSGAAEMDGPMSWGKSPRYLRLLYPKGSGRPTQSLHWM